MLENTTQPASSNAWKRPLNTQYYGPFYGHGIMQPTWVGNYLNYGNFHSSQSLRNNVGAYSEKLTAGAPRISPTSLHWIGSPRESGSRQIQWAPRYDPNIIASDPYSACDSGGYYWVSKHHSGAININRVCDLPYTPITAGRVNVLVNGGGNGYHERQAYVAYLMRCLGDDIASFEEVELATPNGNIRVNFLRPKQ